MVDIFCSVSSLIIIRLSPHTDRSLLLAQPVPHSPVDSDLLQLSNEVAEAFYRH